MLRELADVGRNKKLKLKLIGIDANQATIDYAVKLSTKYSNISYMKLDVLSDAFNNIDYDIALSTLFLHHFKNDVALNLMKSLVSKARIGVIVNDLHRHALAYYLFKFITLFINNRMVKKDGLISILRGFRRKELEQFAEQINSKSQIKWKWAFRYQWITYK
jgi:2-polyprenyl-3-methyl-5-hydroxy-6-metoxy-1,4-benzoquinol methylase